MDNQDYMDLVKNQIEHDKLMHSIKPEYREQAEELLKKKKEIMKKNGLFADLQLRKIDKQINKLKNDA